MSFIDCILQNTMLKQTQKDALVKEYKDLEFYATKKYGAADGPHIAAKQYVKNKADELTKKAQNAVNDSLKWNGYIAPDIARVATGIADSKAKTRWGKGLYFESNVAAAGVRRLEKLSTQIGGQLTTTRSAIGGVLEKYRPHLGGLSQDVAGFKLIVEEMHGKASGDADAARAAIPVKNLMKSLIEDYRSAGGIIGNVENFFPHRSLPERLKKAGLPEWKSYIKTELKVDGIKDEKTGIPLRGQELDDFLDAAFNSITSHGVSDIGVDSAKSSALASRRASHRQFHFEDADAFLRYNNKFGVGDTGLYNLFVDYLSGMTRDTVIMREFGANADHAMKKIIRMAEADGASKQVRTAMQGLWDTLTSKNAAHDSAGIKTVALENTQDFLRGVLLGGAVVPAMQDTFFIAMTAKMNGLPATSALKSWVAQLNPLSSADRKFARLNIHVASAVNGNAFGRNRFADSMGRGRMSQVSNAIIDVSGLGIHTDAVRLSCVEATTGLMAISKSEAIKFDDLHPNMRDAFKRWDMDESDYANILKADTIIKEANGAEFITPYQVALVDKVTSQKYASWLYDMSQKASNEPSLLTRAITTGAIAGEAGRGSINKNIASTIMMFKSYGITVTLNHILPALQQGFTEGKWGRAGTIMVTSTIMGASILQAKNYMYGKTAQDMGSWEFWKAAALQGGGFGIFDSFVLGNSNSFNESIAKGLVGPVGGLADDTRKLFLGSFDDALEEGKEAHFIAKLARFATKYAPDVWYTKLLQERLFNDQLNRMADPLYDTKMRRLENKMRKEKGQEFWWAPND